MLKIELSDLYAHYSKSNKPRKRLYEGIFAVLVFGFLVSIYTFSASVFATNPPTATSTPPVIPEAYNLTPSLPGIDLDPQTMAGFALGDSPNSCSSFVEMKSDVTIAASFLKNHSHNLINKFYVTGCENTPLDASCVQMTKTINNLLISYSIYRLESLKINFERHQMCELEKGEKHIVDPWGDIDFAAMAYETIKEVYLEKNTSNSVQIFNTINNKLIDKFNSSTINYTYRVLSDRSKLLSYATEFFVQNKASSFAGNSGFVSTPSMSAYSPSFYFFGIDDTSEFNTIVPLVFEKISRFNFNFNNNSNRFSSIYGEENNDFKKETSEILFDILMPSLKIQSEVKAQNFIDKMLNNTVSATFSEEYEPTVFEKLLSAGKQSFSKTISLFNFSKQNKQFASVNSVANDISSSDHDIVTSTSTPEIYDYLQNGLLGNEKSLSCDVSKVPSPELDYNNPGLQIKNFYHTENLLYAPFAYEIRTNRFRKIGANENIDNKLIEKYKFFFKKIENQVIKGSAIGFFDSSSLPCLKVVNLGLDLNEYLMFESIDLTVTLYDGTRFTKHITFGEITNKENDFVSEIVEMESLVQQSEKLYFYLTKADTTKCKDCQSLEKPKEQEIQHSTGKTSVGALELEFLEYANNKETKISKELGINVSGEVAGLYIEYKNGNLEGYLIGGSLGEVGGLTTEQQESFKAMLKRDKDNIKRILAYHTHDRNSALNEGWVCYQDCENDYGFPKETKNPYGILPSADDIISDFKKTLNFEGFTVVSRVINANGVGYEYGVLEDTVLWKDLKKIKKTFDGYYLFGKLLSRILDKYTTEMNSAAIESAKKNGHITKGIFPNGEEYIDCVLRTKEDFDTGSKAGIKVLKESGGFLMSFIAGDRPGI